jgi:hypothetical protein
VLGLLLLSLALSVGLHCKQLPLPLAALCCILDVELFNLKWNISWRSLTLKGRGRYHSCYFGLHVIGNLSLIRAESAEQPGKASTSNTLQ